MSEFTKQSTAATEQYLAFLAKGQEHLLEQARQFAAAAGEFVPHTPSILPDLPTTRELALAAFSFMEKFIVQQRAFAEQYLDLADKKLADTRAASSGRKP